MKLNTRIITPDGRVGTVCYNNLDGVGGVWGEHYFEMPESGFGESLPAPDFMLREKYNGRSDVEFVTEYSVQALTRLQSACGIEQKEG